MIHSHINPYGSSGLISTPGYPSIRRDSGRNRSELRSCSDTITDRVTDCPW